MKKPLALLSLFILALVVFTAPVQATTIPLTLSLDNPNQAVAAPSSGTTLLDFSGTVMVDSDYRLIFVELNFPFNASHSNNLTAQFDSNFIDFLLNSGTGNYTGSLFSINVPAGTPPDLYAYKQADNTPSQLFLRAQFIGVGELEVYPDATASEAFSVRVTGNGVPEGGSTVLCFGASMLAACFVRRAMAGNRSLARVQIARPVRLRR